MKQIKQLKAKAHSLNPLVQVGKNGINEATIKETMRALDDHELIKVRIGALEKEEFVALAEELVKASKASLVATIGRIAIVFKQSSDPRKRKMKFDKD